MERSLRENSIRISGMGEVINKIHMKILNLGIYYKVDGACIHGIWKNSELVAVNMTTNILDMKKN